MGWRPGSLVENSDIISDITLNANNGNMNTLYFALFKVIKFVVAKFNKNSKTKIFTILMC